MEDELRTPNGSIVPHIFLFVIQITALISPRFAYRRHVFGSALLLVFILSRLRPHFSNDMAVVQPFILGWASYLSVLEKILFSSSGGPEYDFWRVNHPAHEAVGLAAFGPQKLKWALAMMLNMRGIRWNYEVKNIPKLHKKTKTKYLLNQLLALAYYVILGDAVSQLWFYLFFEQDGSSKNIVTLRHNNLIWSFIGTLAFGMIPYYAIQIQYVVSSIIAVGLGISQPEVVIPDLYILDLMLSM